MNNYEFTIKSIWNNGYEKNIITIRNSQSAYIDLICIDLSENYLDYFFPHLILNWQVISTNLTVNSKQLILKLIPGYFEEEPTSIISTEAELLAKGWKPYFPGDSNGRGSDIYIENKVGNIYVDYNDSMLILPKKQYLWFCIEHCSPITITYQVQCRVQNCYLLSKEYSFNTVDTGVLSEFAGDHLRSDIKDVGNIVSKLHQNMRGKDTLSYSEIDQLGLNQKDQLKLKFADNLEVCGNDEGINYSTVIQHITLYDHANLLEVYGFNGYTNRDYYDVFDYIEFARVTKYNFISWSGIMMEWPWVSLLWNGELLLFYDLDEFAECCRLFFKNHKSDACPVCGNSINQYQYSYIDITRIPHQLYFCSKECLTVFNKNQMDYLKKLTKQDLSYFTSLF